MMKPATIEKENRRIDLPGGAIADVVTFRFPAHSLRLTDVDQQDRQVKLRDIAHYRYFRAQAHAEAGLPIVAFCRLERDQPAVALFPGLSYVTETGENLVSANSFITYVMRTVLERGWLRYRQGDWRVAVPVSSPEWRRRAEAVLALLLAQDRLLAASDYGVPPSSVTVESPLDWRTQFAAIGECASLSDVAIHRRPRLVFNTSFFLLENDDVFSHHSALGEAYNLWVTDGWIRRPPLYRRSAILQRADGRWEIGMVGMQDVSVILPSGMRLSHRGLSIDGGREKASAHADLPFSLNDEGDADVRLFTRYFGVAGEGRVVGYTPVAAGRLELAVVGRRVVGWQEGGGLALPQNGFAVSFAPGVLSPDARSGLLAELNRDLAVEYAFARPSHAGIVQALQNGPLLLKNGVTPLTDHYLEAEESFFQSRLSADGYWQVGVVPTDYVTEVDGPRYGRCGLGIDEKGDLVLVMVAGVNRGMGVPGVDSEGATLVELAKMLRDAGAVDAINLDGGGSTQARYHGGVALAPGDRRGFSQVHFERMIPSVGMVF